MPLITVGLHYCITYLFVHCQYPQLEDKGTVSFTALSPAAKRVWPLEEWMNGCPHRPGSPQSGELGTGACDTGRERDDWTKQVSRFRLEF